MRIKKLSQFRHDKQVITICLLKRKIIYLSQHDNCKSVQQVEPRHDTWQRLYTGAWFNDECQFLHSDRQTNTVKQIKGNNNNVLYVFVMPWLLSLFS